MRAANTITATRCPSNARLAFLPTRYGRLCVHVEDAIYATMKEICAPYRGGFWQFIGLSNGGALMVWDTDLATVPVFVDTNGYEGEMSPEAASIVAQLLALSDLSFRFQNHHNGDDIVTGFHRIRDYACRHAEADKIFAAID